MTLLLLIPRLNVCSYFLLFYPKCSRSQQTLFSKPAFFLFCVFLLNHQGGPGGGETVEGEKYYTPTRNCCPDSGLTQGRSRGGVHFLKEGQSPS